MDYLFNNDTFYYIVNGQKTLSKNHAMILAGGDASNAYFYNMDNVWDAVDWTKEPVEPIQSMLDRRAAQIRDKFDWVCLWLTTGYDSQTILETFIRNNIKLDEIAFVTREEYYIDTEDPAKRVEANLYKKFHNPKVLISEFKIGLDYHKTVYNTLKEDWLTYMPGQSLRLSKTSPVWYHNIHEGLKRHKDKTPGRRGDIYGFEKPRLDLRDGNWYAQSHDMVIRDQSGAQVEAFYMTSDMPEIHVKQHHLMMKWLETLPGMCHKMVHDIQSMNVSDHQSLGENRSYYQDWNLALGRIKAKTLNGLHALNKANFKQDIDSFDGIKMLKHLKDTGDNVLKYAYHLRTDFSSEESFVKKFSVPIFGKSWKIREFRPNIIK
jgi:hypothetical protein